MLVLLPMGEGELWNDGSLCPNNKMADIGVKNVNGEVTLLAGWPIASWVFIRTRSKQRDAYRTPFLLDQSPLKLGLRRVVL
jgi:hypothetical protein